MPLATNGQIAERDISSAYPRVETTPKVYLPPKNNANDAEDEAADGMPNVTASTSASASAKRHKASMPETGNFFDKYPGKWGWETWAKRIEYEALLISRTMETVTYAIIGALVGLACGVIPSTFVGGSYEFVLWGPVGAAVGSLLGAATAQRRWETVVKSHDNLL